MSCSTSVVNTHVFPTPKTQIIHQLVKRIENERSPAFLKVNLIENNKKRLING